MDSYITTVQKAVNIPKGLYKLNGKKCTELYGYRIAGNFRQEKISPKPGPMYCRKKSPDLFSRSLDSAKLNSNVIYI